MGYIFELSVVSSFHKIMMKLNLIIPLSCFHFHYFTVVVLLHQTEIIVQDQIIYAIKIFLCNFLV